MSAHYGRWRTLLYWHEPSSSWVRLARTRFDDTGNHRWYFSYRVVDFLSSSFVVLLESTVSTVKPSDDYSFLDPPGDWPVDRWLGYEPHGFMALALYWPASVAPAFADLLSAPAVSIRPGGGLPS